MAFSGAQKTGLSPLAYPGKKYTVANFAGKTLAVVLAILAGIIPIGSRRRR